MVKYSAAEHESAKKKYETTKRLFLSAVKDLAVCDILKSLAQIECALKNGSTVTVKWRGNKYKVIRVEEPMVSEAVNIMPNFRAETFIRVTYEKAGSEVTKLLSPYDIQIIPPVKK